MTKNIGKVVFQPVNVPAKNGNAISSFCLLNMCLLPSPFFIILLKQLENDFSGIQTGTFRVEQCKASNSP